MTRCLGFSDNTLAFLPKLKFLEVINLYAVSTISCSFLATFPENSRVKFVDVCGNQNIDDYIVKAMALSMPNLEYLNFVVK